ncbi:hypothetical protein EJ04DRAFT_581129 [Polyplosphaeria fusca]|uniref:N-acetyltransferase domain-containing protein n=1 Tax=Polyplosphaeria fusca TaxID=682080 RepID=A0A9P4UX95_9PLEO|nr:hypothetical protein EJ04DRAFT_581129 [Polyplosphaeria fusca]
MPLTLAPITKADTISWTRIRAVAYLGPTHELVHSGKPISETSILGVAEERKKEVGQPNNWQFKIVDTDLSPSDGDPADNGGKTIAIAVWSAHNINLTRDGSKEPSENHEPTTNPAEADVGEQSPSFLPPEVNLKVLSALLGPLREAETGIIGTKPYLMLNSLATLPEHRRRGAAKILINWGLDKADTADLPLYLTATEEAKPLYEKCGFKLERSIEFNREVWGGEGSDWHYCMIRHPMAKK